MAFAGEADAGRWGWRAFVREGAHDFDSKGDLGLAGKLWIVSSLLGLAVVWGLFRSQGNAIGHEVIVSVRLAFMVALLLPVLFLVTSRKSLYWLLGATATVGILPEVPLMPYVREGTHLVVLVLAMHLAATRSSSVLSGFRSSVMVRLLSAFCALAFLSTGVNYLWLSNAWQLKVGIAELILISAFTIVLAELSAPSSNSEVPPTIIDGFAWAALAQLAVAPVVMVLAVEMPVSEGNDTIFGLAYWDRLKSTFAGPDQAGAFFLASIPLVIWWLTKRSGSFSRIVAMVYLQLAPWLIIASGSRTCRIAALIVIPALLYRRTTRKQASWIVPSMAVAFAIGFYFQSLPSSLQALDVSLRSVTSSALLLQPPQQQLNMSPKPPLPSLRGRFFEDPARFQLIKDCISDFSSASVLVKLIGSGFGVAGFREGGFSSAHVSVLDALAELGILGVLLLSAFAIAATTKLTQRIASRSSGTSDSELAFALLMALVVVLMTSLTYDVKTWSMSLVIMAALAAAVREQSGPSCADAP